MEKNTYLSDSGNINLFQLFKIVWDRKTKIILIISILLGLIVGILYALISNELASKIVLKKN